MKVNGQDYSLKNWVMTQRKKFWNGKLPDELVDKLNGIGFVWMSQLYTERWNQMFDGLVKYYLENDGSFTIPEK